MSSPSEAAGRKQREERKTSPSPKKSKEWASLVAARAVASSSSPQPRQQHPRRAASPPRPRPGAPKVIVLAGPTASGKSAVSLLLAEKLDGEVINADSVQVYRGLDVGSAKLPFEERRGIPHHLIDVVEPLVDNDFSAGTFYGLARKAIEEIIARGKTPIVVGGTGLYLRWLVHGRPSTKPTSEAGRAWAHKAVEAAVAAAEEAKRKEGLGGDEGEGAGPPPPPPKLTNEERWAAACSALAAAGDPAAAERVSREVNNEYRLLRALAALYEAGPGVTLGSLEAPGLVGGVKTKKEEEKVEHEDKDGNGNGNGNDNGASSSSPPAPSPPRSRSPSPPLLDYDFRCFFLHAPSRETAYRRIDERAEGIVAGGLFAEAAALLLAKGGLPAACSATRAIGYRQAMEGILEVLGRGGEREEGKSGRKEESGEGEKAPPLPTRDDVRAVAAATQAASRRLAHSQYTWFRGDPLYRWVAVPVPDALSEGGGEKEEGKRENDESERSPVVAPAAAEIAESFARPKHDPCGKLYASSSPPSSQAPPSDGRLTKEEEQSLRRYVPRLTLLATESGMEAALSSFAKAVSSLPEEVARAAREEAAKRKRQRERQQM
jgi:tRNA dimethylallyltransferase